MKEYIRGLVKSLRDQSKSRLIVREYLQARILDALQENGAFVSWAFIGGTALRFLYNMPRFSEDLDFSLVSGDENDNFLFHIDTIKKTFEAENYSIDSKIDDNPPVKYAFIKFDGLLYEIGLSAHEREKLSIKVDIDTNPPEGAGFETSIIRKYTFLHLLHYDKSSLFAGKLHAFLSRRYHKGRDLYDLMWYLTDPSVSEPNITLLNNALIQTGWKGGVINSKNWRSQVAEKLDELNWKRALDDLRPFIENQQELVILTPENFKKQLYG
jgi:predicted nucleotidyltransferase component of viral defense system